MDLVIKQVLSPGLICLNGGDAFQARFAGLFHRGIVAHRHQWKSKRLRLVYYHAVVLDAAVDKAFYEFSPIIGISRKSKELDIRQQTLPQCPFFRHQPDGGCGLKVQPGHPFRPQRVTFDYRGRASSGVSGCDFDDRGPHGAVMAIQIANEVRNGPPDQVLTIGLAGFRMQVGVSLRRGDRRQGRPDIVRRYASVTQPRRQPNGHRGLAGQWRSADQDDSWH
jgi:hypothetical protein